MAFCLYELSKHPDVQVRFIIQQLDFFIYTLMTVVTDNEIQEIMCFINILINNEFFY